MARVTGDLAQLVTIYCGQCDIGFGMPSYLYESRKQDRQTWWCPLGHPRSFNGGPSEVRQLQDRLADAQAALDAEQQQRRAAVAEANRLRQAAVRARQRAAAGVCPCCHRTVAQMARHMKTKHPEFGAQVGR